MNHQLALAIHLNYQETLADFCWDNNKLLQEQLYATLGQSGERFLYLWGGDGCGKSHLLQGSCQFIHASQPVTYLPLTLLKEWGPECLDGLEKQALIALDDIDIIAGSKEWEEALFHLFNRVRDNGHSILLVSAKTPPTRIAIELADLRSRLSWGLTLAINELNDEAKIIALCQHANKRGFDLPNNAALFLVKRCTRSMHVLSQILDRLDKASLAAQRKITIPFIKSILEI